MTPFTLIPLSSHLCNEDGARPSAGAAGVWRERCGRTSVLPGLLLILLALLTGVLSGCGGSSGSSPQLGAISITDATGAVPGQLSALPINAKAAVSITVANDNENLGVNWVAVCGGSPVSPPAANPCGTIAPAYAGSSTAIVYTAPTYIPVGGTVTLTASAASKPSITKSITLRIAPLPVTIAISMPPPASIGVSTSVLVSATVTNDLTAAGVLWKATCGSADCGSFKSGLPVANQTLSGGQITYTAPATIPAGGTVTLTATSIADPTQSASASTTIAPISIAVAPMAAAAQAGGGTSLVATVLNDPANLGADWTITCASAPACGSITAHTASGVPAVYTASSNLAPGATVSATATATGDKTRSATSVITIVPAISIAFAAPPPTTVVAGSPITLSAVVTNDLNGAGVDWTATCAAPPCGTFASGSATSPAHTASGGSITFTPALNAPAGTVTLTATSSASRAALPVRSVSAQVTVQPVISVNFVPYAPSQVQQSDATLLTPPAVPLVAAVANDPTNGGLDWTVCSVVATCGQFQTTPALPATATTPATNATYAASVHTANGQAALYVPPSAPPPGAGSVQVMVKAHNPAATSANASVTATIAVVATPSGLALQGKVMAGSQPVSGASVSLYAAGTTGYSSAATPLSFPGGTSSVRTNATGQFTVPAGYACPTQASELYLVALGGNAGAGANPNLALMTALGPCSGLSSAVSLVVNEVTTVASVWPLAPFLSDYAHLGSSAANAATGLANAFANVNNLADVTTGLPLSVTPAQNGVVPRAEINTLAAILNTCTSTTGGAVGDGSACGALFNAANPQATAMTAPTNTVQAALNIALSPSFNTTPGPGSLYALVPSTSAFTPVLTSAPNDWTIALSFTGGGLSTRSAATALALDQRGDVWVTNSRFSSVSLFNSTGAPLSPSGTGNVQSIAGGYQGGGLAFPTAITIDPFGNAWVANANSLSELPNTLPFTSASQLSGTSFMGGGLGSQIKGIASDGTGNIWAVSTSFPGDLAWFAGANTTLNGAAVAPGTPLSPATGFTQGISSPTGAIAIDTAGTVWLLNSGNNSAAEYASASGAFLQSDYGYTQVTPMPINSVLSPGVSSALAIDNPGNVYLSPGTQLVVLKAGGSAANAGGLGSASTALGVNFSQFLALDGGNHVWLLITGGSTNCTSPYTVAELSTGGAELNVNAAGCGYVAPGISSSDTGIAVDGSGDVWVLNSSSLTELVGAAVPVVTPFATGIQNKTLATRP